MSMDERNEEERQRRVPLSRADWIQAARERLQSGGVNAVRVDGLARSLGVTRGSFYFHFADRDDLLGALLEDWHKSNCLPFERLLDDTAGDGRTVFEAVTIEWFGAGTFRPDLDLAVRDWGKSSAAVNARVAAADSTRIALLRRGLQDLGVVGNEALIRARIAYFHQIGYFAVNFTEPLEERLEYVPIYLKVLTGIEDWKELSGMADLTRILAAARSRET